MINQLLEISQFFLINFFFNKNITFPSFEEVEQHKYSKTLIHTQTK